MFLAGSGRWTVLILFLKTKIITDPLSYDILPGAVQLAPANRHGMRIS